MQCLKVNSGVSKRYSTAVLFAAVFLISWTGTASAGSIGSVRLEKNEDSNSGTQEVAEVTGMSLLYKKFRSEFPQVYEFIQDVSNVWAEIDSEPSSTRNSRKGRTLQHFVQKYSFLESGLQNTLMKILSIFAKPAFAYRKDGSVPAIKTPELLKPLVNIPKYLTNHPINFKRHLTNIHHAISKRSVENTETRQVEAEGDSQRQGRTLHKIIPNFEANFNHMFRKIFPTLNQQVQYQGSNDKVYDQETSTGPSSNAYNTNSVYSHRQGLGLGSSSGSVGFTNLIRMIPQIFNRGGESNYGQNQQQQSLFAGGLQRLMAMLSRPIFPSSNNRNQYS